MNGGPTSVRKRALAEASNLVGYKRALTERHTDRRTDGTDFIPSTADAGGNKKPYGGPQQYV